MLQHSPGDTHFREDGPLYLDWFPLSSDVEVTLLSLVVLHLVDEEGAGPHRRLVESVQPEPLHLLVERAVHPDLPALQPAVLGGVVHTAVPGQAVVETPDTNCYNIHQDESLSPFSLIVRVFSPESHTVVQLRGDP